MSTEHNTWASFHPLTRVLDARTCRIDEEILAVSDEVRRSMTRAARARSTVLVHGVDVPAIAARRRERTAARSNLGLDEHQLAVVAIANLRDGKDYPNLLRAARLVADALPSARFFSVGQGPLEQDLHRLRDELGLPQAFRFLGYQEDPIRVLAAADVFCLSSWHEGLPSALLEAFALGVPAVATAVGGVPQVITDGVEGALVPARDPESLAAALLKMAEPSMRVNAATAASERSTAFDIQRAVDFQQEMYLRLPARARR